MSLTNKPIGIIGALSSETEFLIKQLDDPVKTEMIGTSYYSGKINGKSVVIVTCGVGKVNAACITQAMIQKFDVGAIVNTGIAGGIDKKIKPCDVVISNELVYHDFVTDVPVFEAFKADKTLMSLAENACKEIRENRDFNHYIGLIATGDQFVTDSETKAKIAKEVDPLCVEMEGGAIAHCSVINNVPFVVIRAISDTADDNAIISFYEFKEIASNMSASIVMSILKNI